MGKSHYVSIIQKVGKMGWVVKMDEKGRVVIPAEVRNKLGLKRGYAIILELKDSQLVLSLLEDVFTEQQNNQLKDFISDV